MATTVIISEDTEARLKHYSEHLLASIWDNTEKEKEEARSYAVEILDAILFDPDNNNALVPLVGNFKEEFYKKKAEHYKP